MFKDVSLRHDLPAGIVVFFVAVPLCLGIALASGAPLLSGLIAGIVGGIVVGFLSGSALGVSGPAAGLAVIVATAIERLGSFEAFLVAVVLAGLIQIALGVARAGLLAHFFPTAVVKGMLSGIGLLIILKQIPHAIGWDRDPEGDFSFRQLDGETTVSEIGVALGNFEPSAALIAGIALAILILWDAVLVKRARIFRLIQGPLVAVVIGIVYQVLTTKLAPGWALSTDHLVQIPAFGNLAGFAQALTFPSFSELGNPAIYVTAITLAVVASLETLLCVEATDKLDPDRRVTPVNRELIAQGAGNTIAGLVGGLPVTQVIVRSSANIQSGARSKASAIFHGLQLLGAVVFGAGLMNLVPLAVLASILFVVGYKLAKPELFVEMYKLGWSQFVPFIVTILAILATDLLTGVLLGLAVGVCGVLYRSYVNSHWIEIREGSDEDQRHTVHMRLGEHVSFLSRGAILRELSEIPDGSHVVLDLSRTHGMDHDVAEILEDFHRSAHRRNLRIETGPSGSAEARIGATGTSSLFVPPSQADARELLSPDDVLDELLAGNSRFREKRHAPHDLLAQVEETSGGQWPIAAILGCIDSRTSPELIFDQGVGHLFSARIAGNFLNDDILGSFEFACHVAGAKLVVVMGHTQCGAIKGACDGVELGHLTGMLANLKPALDAVPEPKDPAQRTSGNPTFVESVARTNVRRTVEAVTDRSAVLREMAAANQIKVVGGMYDVASGRFELV